ncbi:hypothetical protein [uncultured Microbacterium sp.]|uniref:YobI family P-loop NTPase n=1 Tax=uncultured Microbacterium sp. TaxID=191216 RepID=UPI0037496101
MDLITPPSENTEEVPQPRPHRNLALTGSYGSGKSSILKEVERRLEDRVVNLSLSTLGREPAPRLPNGAETPETPAITNAIQKEIVKQLLYREKPSAVSGSRYRRIEPFDARRAGIIAGILAALGTLLIASTGFAGRIESILNGNPFGLLGLYLAIFGILGSSVYLIQKLFHNQIWIEKLSTASATVSLTGSTSSYFDQYLDEIVHFFETTSHDVVIIEDLDRFDDPYIFETLRELSTLLNNSDQIKPRTITFLYAVKDSIFEQLGKISVHGKELTKQELKEFAATNRAKFFDIVVPVVPFISKRNARDLLSKELGKSGFKVSKGLIDLSSKHLIDMRLIKNVHNEYGIFAQKILGPGGITELKHDQLFAMVVYKNLNLADFEKIKAGESDLDKIFTDYRTLVNEQIRRLNTEAAQLERNAHRKDAAQGRAEELGERLEELLSWTLNAAGGSIAGSSFTFGGSDVSTADWKTTEFWSRWVADQSLVLEVTYSIQAAVAYYSPQTVQRSMSIAFSDVRAKLDANPDPEAWSKDGASAARRQAEAKRSQAADVRRASMQALFELPEFTLSAGSDALSFEAAVRARVGDGLTLDLIRDGFIDRYFGLYVSLYYDDTVTAQARNFILHAVDANEMDINAPVGDATEIAAMIDDAGDTFFSGRSVFNIDVFDALLTSSDPRFTTSLKNLAAMGDDAAIFLDAYVSSGNYPEKLFAALTPYWPDVFQYLVVSDIVGDDRRLALLDAALGAADPTTPYSTPAELRELVEAEYASISTLTTDQDVAPEGAMRVMTALDPKLADLRNLSKSLREHAIERSLYVIDLNNISLALGDGASVALDQIAATHGQVYTYLIDNLPDYVRVFQDWPKPAHTIDTIDGFVQTVNDIASQPRDAVSEVLANAAGSWSIRKIESASATVWPVLMGTGHIKHTFANLARYVDARGIDDDAAAWLEQTPQLSEVANVEEPKKLELAAAVVNSPLLSADTKVATLLSLALDGHLPITSLENGAVTGEAMQALVSNGLVEDSEDTFEYLDGADWGVRRGFILGSRSFHDYFAELTLSREDITAIITDPAVKANVKDAILANLTSLESRLTPEAAGSAAEHAIAVNASLVAPQILVLARSHAPAPTLVKLIDHLSPATTTAELLSILGAMPGPYDRLVEAGGWVRLPNTAEDIRLADNLDARGVVSSRDPEPVGETFRVNKHRRFEA